jgi:hypothetical protein
MQGTLQNFAREQCHDCETRCDRETFGLAGRGCMPLDCTAGVSTGISFAHVISQMDAINL